MKVKDFLKWGSKWDTGIMIFIITFLLGLVLFINRYDLLFKSVSQLSDFCIKENVKFWQVGFLQLLRSFLEHFTFNFVLPIIFVIFSFGIDRLFKRYTSWKLAFVMGAFCSVLITFIWEFQKRPVEIIEVVYDLLAVIISYLFIRWILSEMKKGEIKLMRK
jgi:hypothetical protein